MPNYLNYGYWLDNLIIPLCDKFGYTINDIRDMSFFEVIEIKNSILRNNELDNARKWFSIEEQNILNKMENGIDSTGKPFKIKLIDKNIAKKEINRLYGN